MQKQSKNLTKNSLKKKVVSGALSLGFFTASLAGLSFNFDNSSYVRALTQDISTNFTNNDFYTEGTGTPPGLTSGWEKITTNVSADEDIVSGIYNSKTYQNNKADYLDDYSLFADANPGLVDNDLSLAESNAKYKSLMINSPQNYGRAGYKTKSNITLEANSYYKFSVLLKTIKAVNNEENDYADEFDARASIYIKGFTDQNVDASIEMIDSTLSSDSNENGWATYSIYVQTTSYKTESVSLELWLGSESESAVGAVFFNKVEVQRFSKDAFETDITDNGAISNKKVVRLGATSTTTTVENGNFSQAYNVGWNTIESSNNALVQTITITNNEDIKYITDNGLTDADIPTSSNLLTSDNINALLMYNPNDSDYAIVESSPITIKQHGYYRISVWAWCDSSEGTTPSIALVDKSSANIDTVTINTNTSVSASDNFNGGWTRYNFYVYGPAYNDGSVALRLQLGTSEKTTSGYVYFDDVEITPVTYSEYNSGSSATNSKSFNYNNYTTNYLVDNDTFNVTHNEDNQITYPLAPSNWKENLDEYYSKSGVINTDPTHFNSNLLNYTSAGLYPHNPGKVNGGELNNNVLMIGNLAEGLNQSYTSNSFTLNSKSYYKLTAYVSTNCYSTSGSASVKLYTSNQTLFEYTGIRNNSWKQIVLYIATGENSLTTSIDLGMTAQGFAFFDNITVETSTESAFNTALSNNSVSTINLKNESFENVSEGTGETHFDITGFEGNNYSVDTADNQISKGIVDLTGYQFDGFSASAQDGKNAMYITSDSDSYYTLTSNNSYTFNSGTYYKLSIFVMTNNIHHSDNDGVYGASITLNYGDNSKTFYGINTSDGTHNDWTEYAFYINVNETTTSTIELALGSELGETSGLVLFDNISLNTIDENVFNDLDTSDSKIIKIDTTVTDKDTENNSEEAFDGTFDWYLIPSILTALAIFIALIGSMLRKINWKRKAKVDTTYDRRATLDKHLNTREQIESRKNTIEKLQENLAKNEQKIADFKQTSATKEDELQATLDGQNAEILNNIKTINDERKRIEHDRNAILANDKSAFSAEQELQYLEKIKSIEKSENKFNRILQRKQKELVALRENNANKLNSMIAESEFIKNEIKTITAEIKNIEKYDHAEWEEQKQAKEQKMANKAKKELKVEEVEITPPSDNK